MVGLDRAVTRESGGMSSKAKDGGGGKGGGGGDGGRDKKRKKKKGDKGDKCNKCKTLFPIMYKMKDLLSTLQPQCNQYRVSGLSGVFTTRWCCYAALCVFGVTFARASHGKTAR